ncbi:MAG: hypothetical protein U0840_20590 [Gemmataceae bacterium]
MNRMHGVGIGVGHLEVATAWAAGSGVPASQVRTYLTDVLPGASVVCQAGTGILPVTFRSARPLLEDQLDWLGVILGRLHSHWQSSLPPGELRAMLTVASGVSESVRARCREIARRTGWEGMRVVGNDLAVSRMALSNTHDPQIILLIELEFEEVWMSVATVLGGVTRVRSRLRLRLLSHRLVDELIVAHGLRSLGRIGPRDLSDWVGLWHDACRLRRELGTSEAGAVELAAPGWGGEAQLVSLTREELWPWLVDDVESLCRAGRELLERSLTPRERLHQVLLIGGGLLHWTATRALLRERFGTVVESYPVQAAAVGAALLACEPDDLLPDTLDILDPQWVHTWEQTIPSVCLPLVSSTPDLETMPEVRERTPAGADEYQRTVQTLWSYLRGVASVDRPRARQLIELLRTDCVQFLQTLDQPPSPSAHLARARQALDVGRPGEAISASHDAFQENPDDPMIFREMIALHVEAALAEADDERAINWLECAHGHDQANAEIHRHLASRCRRQADQLARLDEPARALAAIRRSLMFEPLDGEARALERRLEARLAHGSEGW